MTLKVTMKSLVIAGLCAVLSSGCANYQSQQEQTGMVIGGLMGGALGSTVGGGDGRTAAIILGSVVGAAFGGSVGRQPDGSWQVRN